MKNDKRYSLKDIVFIVWFIIALTQVHIGLLLYFGITNFIMFLLLHGILMGVEGIFAAIMIYPFEV